MCRWGRLPSSQAAWEHGAGNAPGLMGVPSPRAPRRSRERGGGRPARTPQFRLRLAVAALAVLWGTGCGMIADKGRIRVAKIDDDYITRDDLDEVIYETPGEERPEIRSRSDLLVVLQTHIDTLIKWELAQQLEVDAIVVVDEEHVLLVVAALRDVVRHTRDDDPRDSGHASRIAARPRLVNINW